MRRNGFTLREMLVLIVVLFGVGWILFPSGHWGNARRTLDRRKCQDNLKSIALACAIYSQNYDGFMPPISIGKLGWADLIETEAKMLPMFQCPATNQTNKKFSIDYFFNARIAGEKRSRISAGALTIAFGDGLDNGATNSHLSELPLDWKTDEDSPVNRHLSGANYALVDGHVKWFRADKISTQAPNRKDFVATFAVR